jgi:lactoylglutathione lyase
MTRIASITIYVTDLEAAITFYSTVLGFELDERMGDAVATLKHDGPAVVLSKATTARSLDYPNESGVVVGLPVTDLDARLAALKSKKVKLVTPDPEPFPMGRFVALRDPSGNVVELLEFA